MRTTLRIVAAPILLGSSFALGLPGVAHSAPRADRQPLAPMSAALSFQVESDFWTTRTGGQVVVANRINADRRMDYREGVTWNPKTGLVSKAPLWGAASHWTIKTLTVQVPTTDTAQQAIVAEERAAAWAFGVDFNHFSKAKVGHVQHNVYLIPEGGWDNTSTWREGPHELPHVLVGSRTN